MILTPNAQEVIDHFEGAEIVTCLSDNLDYRFEISGLHYDGNTDSWYIYVSDDEHGAISILIWSSRLEKYATIVKGTNTVNYEDESDYVKGQLNLIQLIKEEITIFEAEANDITDLSLDILFLLKKLEPLQQPKKVFKYTNGANMGINDFNREQEDKPKQYKIGIDTFERAESNMDLTERLACVRFNIDKYAWRKKDQDFEDFNKIIAYAEYGLKQLKK